MKNAKKANRTFSFIMLTCSSYSKVAVPISYHFPVNIVSDKANKEKTPQKYQKKIQKTKNPKISK